MPTVKVVNPRRSRKRRASRKRNRSRSRGRSFTSRVRSAIAPLLKGGNVSRKKRKRNRSHRRRNRTHRVRHRNPFLMMGRPKRRRSSRRARRANRHHHRSHRNPNVLGMSMSELLAMVGGGVGNGIITRSGPQMLLGANNTGIMGYGANAAFAVAGAWVIKAMF